MKIYSVLLFFIATGVSCTHSQTDEIQNVQLIGGPCEGCEAIFEYGDRLLKNTATLPGYDEAAQKLKISGTIYQPGGKLPAKDVVLYIYHTDQNGIYANKYNRKNWERRHGYRRGWIKTDDDGRYTFFTSKPGIYPNRAVAAHIHPTLLEPNGNYYYVEDYYFSDDSLLTEKELNPVAPRGGTPGVLSLKKDGEVYVAERDFILGKNVGGN
ncbi:MAG: intradiol ring-cleavage dioxygenase [Bacteroidota bacterium]